MAWLERVRNVFRPERVHREIGRELAFHVNERAEELRAQGLSEDEARREARRQFGNVGVQVERTRDVDVAGALDGAVRNLRYAMRTLRKTPGFTLTVVATLALGIGANSAVFSAIDAVLLQPLPFPDGDRLMRVQQRQPRSGETAVAPTRLEDWNRLSDSFESLSGYYTQDGSELSGELPEKVTQAFAAPRFLETLGISPLLGRDFTSEEQHFGGPVAVLLSERYWRRRFGADPDVTAKTVRLGTTSWPIVGVLPASMASIARNVDVWTVSPPDAPVAQSREETWFRVIGRLKPGVTLEQARANLAVVQGELGRQYPQTDAALRVEIDPLKQVTVGGTSGSLWVLYGAVTLLLLIACTNIAALLLARATQRQQEIAVRFSLGATRGAVAGQLLAEAFVLAVTGAALGLFLAGGVTAVFQTWAGNLPRVEEIRLDWRIVAYSLGCAVAATVLCGVLPALRGTRDVSGGLVAGGRTQVSGRHRVQSALVAVQVALAVTLLAGAGLLVRSFQELGRVTPGFEVRHVLTFQVSANWAETGDMRGLAEHSRQTREFLQTIPGVEAVAAAMRLPGMPGAVRGTEFTVAEGRAAGEPKIVAVSRPVSSSYFETMRIPLLAGELCKDPLGPRTYVVNRSFADRYFHGDPLGYHFRLPQGPPAPIAGVVGDAREAGIQEAPVPTVYGCYGLAQPGNYYLVRTRGEPGAMAETIRQKLHEFEPNRSMYSVATLEDSLSDAFAEDRLRTLLLVFFAVTAVSLACMGLYGLLTYTVNTRRREVGLRLALGARRSEIVRRFLGEGLALTLAGCVAGVALAAAFVRVLSGMLYGVAPSDALTWAGVIALVLAVAAGASLLPAVRAARVDPMEVLREE